MPWPFTLKPSLYAHITKTPGVCGGQAVIDDTRVRVKNIALLDRQGQTLEQMLEAYPQLTRAQVYAALTYCYDNAEEIDAALEANRRAFDELDRRWREHLARHDGRPDPASARSEGVYAQPFPWPPKTECLAGGLPRRSPTQLTSNAPPPSTL